MNNEKLQENFLKLFKNELTFQEAQEFLTYLYQKGETKEDIQIAANVMRSFLIPLEVDASLQDKLIDIVGTGGDKSGSFNISSTSALITASLGAPVAKHGSKAATSKSGSADMLQALGINLHLEPKKQKTMLEECGFVFMFSVNHHPAMKYIMPIRKSLSHPTIFNFLGPLCNPAGVKRYLLGTFPKKLQTPIAEVLMEFDSPKSCVVNSVDGLDEISISDATDIIEIDKKNSKSYQIKPEDFGLKTYPFDSILGDTPLANAKITYNILQGEGSEAQEGIVLLNSALALKVAQLARDMQEGIEMAKEAIQTKKAFKKMQEIIEVSNKL